jgi:hypothetical protein
MCWITGITRHNSELGIMAKCMTADRFINLDHLRSFLDRFIQTTLMNMMTSLYTASWINGNCFSWKHILPGKFHVGVFVFRIGVGPR